MKDFLSKFFGLLAVVAITLTALVYVLDGSLFSARYLNQAANRSNLYDNIAKHLPEILSEGSTKPEVVKTSLGLFLTPDFIQQQIEPWFEGLEGYYKHNGPSPQLELSALQVQASQYGITLPSVPPFNAPIIWHDPGLKPLAERLDTIKIVGPLAAILLLIFTGMMRHGFKRYSAMAKTLVVAALVQGGLYLLAMALPTALSSPLSNQRELKIIAPDVIGFFKTVGNDNATSFAQIGIGLVVAAAACILLGVLIKVSSRVGKHKESSVRPDSDKRLELH